MILPQAGRGEDRRQTPDAGRQKDGPFRLGGAILPQAGRGDCFPLPPIAADRLWRNRSYYHWRIIWNSEDTQARLGV